MLRTQQMPIVLFLRFRRQPQPYSMTELSISIEIRSFDENYF